MLINTTYKATISDYKYCVMFSGVTDLGAILETNTYFSLTRRDLVQS